MRLDKRKRAMDNFNGFRGPATVAHVERNVLSAYPAAQVELTGKQYGQVMSAANTSYHDGASSQKIDTWAYDGELDWLAGIRGTDTIIEAMDDTITIIQYARTEREIKHIYKRINGGAHE